MDGEFGYGFYFCSNFDFLKNLAGKDHYQSIENKSEIEQEAFLTFFLFFILSVLATI